MHELNANADVHGKPTSYFTISSWSYETVLRPDRLPFCPAVPSTLCDDGRTTGILVQLPLPGHINEQKVLDLILPDKVGDTRQHKIVACLAQEQPQ